MSIAFLLTSLVVVVAPGTGALYTMAAGLSRGTRAGIIAAFGCTLGTVPHMVAAVTGLAALLHASALAFRILTYIGVGYLLYMAYSTIRATGAFTIETGVPAPSTLKVIGTAILSNLSNPKLTIFFFVFLPQFVRPGGRGTVPAMLELGTVFMALTLVVFVGYGIFAAAVRDHVIARPRVLVWTRRFVAAAFVALAAKLTFAEG